eukprot:TRINITY_DN870_c0_g2_i1.p1 TRINITY_DN870_c0_g2~~TRINITY_DN870_c0_g2_i1.p1  ORF type:complete len:437 (+),score=53.08 TRINITY_DN870_c0_g2_i1:94-1404(+)
MWSLTELWSMKEKIPFSSISIGRPLKGEGVFVLFGHMDGTLSLLSERETRHAIERCHLSQQRAEDPSSVQSNTNATAPFPLEGTSKLSNAVPLLDVKGGAVSSLIVSPVSNFGVDDVIAADASGNVTVFCNGELLNSRSLTLPATSLAVVRDVGHTPSIIAGDGDGNLTALPLHASDHLWKARICDLSGSAVGTKFETSIAVTCVIALKMSYRRSDQRNTDQKSVYDVCTGLILVSDSTGGLHFFTHEGERVMYKQAPSPVRTMCAATYRESSLCPVAEPPTSLAGVASAPSSSMVVVVGEADTDSSSSPEIFRQCIAMGCDDGTLYAMWDFQLNILAHCDHAVTGLLPLDDVLPASTHDVRCQSESTLLCYGHFNGFRIFVGGQLHHDHHLSDWVHTAAVQATAHNTTGMSSAVFPIVVGCLDGSVRCYGPVASA